MGFDIQHELVIQIPGYPLKKASQNNPTLSIHLQSKLNRFDLWVLIFRSYEGQKRISYKILLFEALCKTANPFF